MAKKQYLVCNCEKTMPLDETALSRALREGIEKMHMSLCRAQLASFETALQSGDELVVACTQEAPLFSEIADEKGTTENISFVNIRENAGWSKDTKKAIPKIAALLKDAEFKGTPARLKPIHSNGMCLVYGAGQQALEIAQLMGQRLSVTLVLSDEEDIVLPMTADIPVYRGDIVRVSGSFGNFEVVVDKYAPLRPASRGNPEFAVPRNGATASCSLIMDMSGNSPLFAGHSHRDGYAHVEPGDPVSAYKTAIKFMDMVGEFEKPIYVDYTATTCAHSRSGITGCNKCLDVCPAGAIRDIGASVEFDPGICGGCGSCHAVCPTGSVAYQYPIRSDVIARVQSLFSAYSSAGGKAPVLLLHDQQSGIEMISAIARYGDGLPAEVIPLGFHAVTALGHVELLGMLASGATQILLLADANRQEEFSSLNTEIDLANTILAGLGLADQPRIEMISEADPDKVEQRLWGLQKQGQLETQRFNPQGGKREIARLVFARLHASSRLKPEIIDLQQDAPYGAVEIDQDSCTLCMACTSACPANAITDTPGEPKLRFTQSACVQCGLCVRTCPEQALSLKPQLDFTASSMQPVTLKEEEPFNCISCGTPFAAKSTIERISGQLAGKHAMFSSEERAELIKMCENCRIEAQANSSDDPFAAGARPKPRTTEDYLNAENGTLGVDDFLIDD